MVNQELCCSKAHNLGVLRNEYCVLGKPLNTQYCIPNTYPRMLLTLNVSAVKRFPTPCVATGIGLYHHPTPPYSGFAGASRVVSEEPIISDSEMWHTPIPFPSAHLRINLSSKLSLDRMKFWIM